MFTRKFWMDLGERVIASAAGGALAVLTVTSDPAKVAIGAGVGALVSLLKGLVATQVGDKSSASLTS